VCKKKTNKGKIIIAGKKVVDAEIREATQVTVSQLKSIHNKIKRELFTKKQ